MEKVRNKIIKYLLIYTFSFCILFLLCFYIYFLINGKNMFDLPDGLEQHYLIFTNLGISIRNIFSKGISFWNNGIGYGADVMISNAAYYLDIFNYISVLFPVKYSLIGYNLMLVLKLYFCGLSFTFFASNKKLSSKITLIGSLLYVFSGYSFIIFIQPFFINPLIIFPFIIVGVDKLLKENNPKIYFIALLISFINYFYFAYMMCIGIVLYFIISYIFNYKDKSIKNLFSLIFKFLLYSILAFLSSSFILLPVFSTLLSSSRLSINYYLPILYPKSWYTSFLTDFLSGGYFGRDEMFGFGATGLISVLLLFILKDKYKKEKIEFITLTILFIIPFFGHVMNGFSYYTNRWSFMYTLMVTYISCIILENMKDIKKENIYIALFILIIYDIFCYKTFIFGINLIVTFISLILIYSFRNKKDYYKVIYALTLISLVTLNIKNGDEIYQEILAPNNYNYNSYINNTNNKMMNKNLYKDGSRFIKETKNNITNVPWIYGVSGISHYISLYNNDINSFQNDIGLVTNSSVQKYKGLESRSLLSYLMNVKYYITDDKNKLPYGYDNKVMSVNNITMYKSKYKTSLVYGFDNKISYKDYLKYNIYDRNKILASNVVLDNGKSSKNTLSNDSVKYNMKLDKVKKKESNYYAKKDGVITLSFNDIKDSEVYLSLNNININSYDGKFIRIDGYYNNNQVSSIYKDISTYKHHMYGDKHNYLVNLGNIKNINNIRIYLTKGKYEISSIKVYSMNNSYIDSVEKSLDKLNSKTKVSNDRFDIDVDLDKSKYVFISVPYSKGWSAYVDGKKKEIKKANTAFMALYLSKGKHQIILKYKTPYLKLGIIISAISILLFIIIYMSKK